MEQTEYIVPAKLITLNERIKQEHEKLKLPLTDKLQAFASALPAEQDKEVVILDNLILISSRIIIADENDEENLEKARRFSRLMKKFNGAVDGWAKESKEDADSFRNAINERRDLLKAKIAEVKANVDPKLEKIKMQLDAKIKQQNDELEARYIKRYNTFESKGMRFDGLKKRFYVPGHPDVYITEEELRLLESDELKKRFAEDIVPTLLAVIQSKPAEVEDMKVQVKEHFSDMNEARLSELCELFGKKIDSGNFVFPSGFRLAIASLYLYDPSKYQAIIARERQLGVIPENAVVPNDNAIITEGSPLSEKLAADLAMLQKAHSNMVELSELKLHSEMMRHGLVVFEPKIRYLILGLKGMIDECKAAETRQG
jgi:hypothetical protein